MEYFQVTKEEVENKSFNVFVGISLGNKLLTPALTEKYVKWAHNNTKDNAVILIADKIDIVNWIVFLGLEQKEAAKKVQQKAYGFKGMFDKAIRSLSRKENDPTYITNTHILFWDDIKNKGYNYLQEILWEEYKTNKKFRERILYFVDKYIELREAKVPEEDKNRLSKYIIDELPTLLGGIYWNNTLYNLILYPTYVDSRMSQFVLDIRGGKYFDSSKLQLRQLCLLVEDRLQKPAKKQTSCWLMKRCEWPGVSELMIKYHDEEWGKPCHDDRKLFEYIILDSFQAGLSWSTILNKRENFRKAFDNFNAKKISSYNKKKINELLGNAGIIRNKLKINATITNAQAFLDIQKEFGSFDRYIWQFVGGKTITNKRKSMGEIVASTKESDEMSKALKKRGFKFVGTTICYAFMQAAGLVNDHTVYCFRYKELINGK